MFSSNFDNQQSGGDAYMLATHIELGLSPRQKDFHKGKILFIYFQQNFDLTNPNMPMQFIVTFLIDNSMGSWSVEK